MLDDRHQEALPHSQLSGLIQVKILRTALQCGLQNPAIHLEGFQRIGEHIGCNHIPDCDLPVKALHHIGKAGDRKVRPRGLQLDLVEEIGNG